MEFKEELKQKIIFQNEVYRSGTLDVNFVTDAEWDYNLEQYESLCTPEEFEQFRVTLMEQKGDFKFEFVVGSLLKIKYENPEELYKWIKKYSLLNLWVSEKLDGCSGVLFFDKGKFVSAYSRGDGESGTDWTDKALKISSIPKTIAYQHPIYIRGEFVLTGDSHIKLGMSNRRNAVVGIMNRKEVTQDVEEIKYFAYEVMSEKWFIERQFEFLQTQDFLIPKVAVFHPESNIHEELKIFYFNCKETSLYDIDGLVVSDKDYIPEPNEFFPNKKIAFKINSLGFECEVVDIHWEISKQQLLKPVIEINPVDMDGAIVRRVTAFNAKFLIESMIDIGAKIRCCRSGEVIPFILDVIKGVDKVNLPSLCPSCGELLDWKGVDLHCGNPKCEGSSVKRVFSFLRDCGVENVATKTLENWNIITFDDLLAWKPETGSKSQNKFAKELEDKVFSKPFLELFSHMVFDGCGTKNILKIVDFYGFDAINTAMSADKAHPATLKLTLNKGFPTGIGSKTIIKIMPDWKNNIEILTKLTLDPRYKPKLEAKVERKEIMDSKLNGKKILFTGTLSCKRSEAEEKAKDQGAIIASSVNKELDYLVVGEDQWGKSSKFLKAEKIGVKILTEAEFNTLIG